MLSRERFILTYFNLLNSKLVFREKRIQPQHIIPVKGWLVCT